MYKQVLESVNNIEIWPVISLIFFFLFFVGVVITVILSDKKFIKKMKEMPLNDGILNNDESKPE